MRVHFDAGGGSTAGSVGFPRARNRPSPAARWASRQSRGFDMAVDSARNATASGVVRVCASTCSARRCTRIDGMSIATGAGVVAGAAQRLEA